MVGERRIGVAVGLRLRVGGDRQRRLVDGEIGSDEGDDVIRAGGQRVLADGVSSGVFTRGAAECSGQAIAGDERTGGDGVREGGVGVAVGLGGRVRGDRQGSLVDGEREGLIDGEGTARGGDREVVGSRRGLTGKHAGGRIEGQARGERTVGDRVGRRGACRGRDGEIQGVAVDRRGVVRAGEHRRDGGGRAEQRRAGLRAHAVVGAGQGDIALIARRGNVMDTAGVQIGVDRSGRTRDLNVGLVDRQRRQRAVVVRGEPTAGGLAVNGDVDLNLVSRSLRADERVSEAQTRGDRLGRAPHGETVGGWRDSNALVLELQHLDAGESVSSSRTIVALRVSVVRATSLDLDDSAGNLNAVIPEILAELNRIDSRPAGDHGVSRSDPVNVVAGAAVEHVVGGVADEGISRSVAGDGNGA